jgi:hypothetical protein
LLISLLLLLLLLFQTILARHVVTKSSAVATLAMCITNSTIVITIGILFITITIILHIIIIHSIQIIAIFTIFTIIIDSSALAHERHWESTNAKMRLKNLQPGRQRLGLTCRGGGGRGGFEVEAVVVFCAKCSESGGTRDCACVTCVTWIVSIVCTLQVLRRLRFQPLLPLCEGGPCFMPLHLNTLPTAIPSVSVSTVFS